MSADTWVPEFAPWRHGGWYVVNVRWPNGGCGCVSRNYPDRKWRIVCDTRSDDHVYATRSAAARAERALVAAHGTIVPRVQGQPVGAVAA